MGIERLRKAVIVAREQGIKGPEEVVIEVKEPLLLLTLSL